MKTLRRSTLSVHFISDPLTELKTTLYNFKLNEPLLQNNLRKENSTVNILKLGKLYVHHIYVHRSLLNHGESSINFFKICKLILVHTVSTVNVFNVQFNLFFHKNGKPLQLHHFQKLKYDCISRILHDNLFYSFMEEDNLNNKLCFRVY